MIPDKIYLSTGTVSSNIPEERYALPGWHEKPNPKTANETYIRKDALLEWAKNELENSVYQYSRDYGLALNSLIDKLNHF